MALGVKRFRSGRLAEAEQTFRGVLARQPDQVDALHFLGLLRYKQGSQQEGLELVRRAVALCPGYADAQNNLGNLLSSEERLPEARAAYERALASNPRHPQAWNNLGVALKNLGLLDEATAAYRRAFEVSPSEGDAHLNLATILILKGREDEAIAEYQRALELEPSLIHGFGALVRSLRNRGREAEALAVLEKLRQRLPEHPVVLHMVAAHTGQNVPLKANETYVRAIFDGFADTFDHVLQGLDYRAPALVAAEVQKRWPVPEARLEVLDAGCGTGLCGRHLKPYARRLVGVDLSAAMLAKARQGNCYDELIQAELTSFLQAHSSAYHLITSADTLVYFGDLAPVFVAAAEALRPTGMLVFSVEDAQRDLSAGFQLHPHGRYSHSEGYVRAELARAGFARCTVCKAVLRNEAKLPVAGLVIAAFKE